MQKNRGDLQMDKVHLTASQILYLAALCGADDFYGVPDGFYGMDNVEIAIEVNSIKMDLTVKGYSEMDFNGEFKVNPEILSGISKCADFDIYISLDRNINNINSFLRFYIKGSEIYKLVKNQNEYVIDQINGIVLKQEVSDFMSWNRENEELIKGIDLEKTLLKKVKTMSELEKPEKLLIEAGCDGVTAKLIYNGMQGNGGYYSFTVLDRLSDTNKVKSLIFLYGKEGALQLQPVFQESKEWVRFIPISYERAVSKLEALFKNIACEPEECFE